MSNLKTENKFLKKCIQIWENAALKQAALKVTKADKYYQELKEIKQKLNEFADKFDCFDNYIDTIEVRDEGEFGYYMTEEEALSGTNLEDFEALLRDFIEYVGYLNERTNNVV